MRDRLLAAVLIAIAWCGVASASTNEQMFASAAEACERALWNRKGDRASDYSRSVERELTSLGFRRLANSDLTPDLVKSLQGSQVPQTFVADTDDSRIYASSYLKFGQPMCQVRASHTVGLKAELARRLTERPADWLALKQGGVPNGTYVRDTAARDLTLGLFERQAVGGEPLITTVATYAE